MSPSITFSMWSGLNISSFSKQKYPKAKKGETIPAISIEGIATAIAATPVVARIEEMASFGAILLTCSLTLFPSVMAIPAVIIEPIRVTGIETTVPAMSPIVIPTARQTVMPTVATPAGARRKLPRVRLPAFDRRFKKEFLELIFWTSLIVTWLFPGEEVRFSGRSSTEFGIGASGNGIGMLQLGGVLGGGGGIMGGLLAGSIYFTIGIVVICVYMGKVDIWFLCKDFFIFLQYDFITSFLMYQRCCKLKETRAERS